MPSLDGVDLLKTKDLHDVSLAQILFDACVSSTTGIVLVSLDKEGTGFVVVIPQDEREKVN